MNKRICAFAAIAAAAALLGTAGLASAAIFTDATGENFDGNAHMDIASVEVTNTLTDITFKINLNGSIANPTDWGKYLVGIDTNSGTGDTGNPVGNPWGRNIRMSAGMDAFIGSWVDGGGGAQPWTFTSSWTQNGQVTPVLGTTSTTITVPLSTLNLVPGQTINFDVYSSGGNGGDSANDALGLATQTINDWQVPYDSGNNVRSYTLAVPEPATIGALGLAGLSLLARRRRA
jgi:hypothetical protein